MTDNSNNNLSQADQSHTDNPTSHGHLQDKLVKDSIAHNQSITAQVKARQNQSASTTLNANAAADSSNNNDFTQVQDLPTGTDRKSTRLNSSHVKISYAVSC